jgi:hypothetical protein
MDLDRSSGSGCSLCARLCGLYKDSKADECASRTREAAGWSEALKVDKSLSVSSIVGVRCPSAGDIKCLGGGGRSRRMMIIPSKRTPGTRELFQSSLNFSLKFAVHRLRIWSETQMPLQAVDWPIIREPRLSPRVSRPIKIGQACSSGVGCW